MGAHPAQTRWIGLVTCRLKRASHCGNCISTSNSLPVAYLKPPWFTVKIFNRIAMATGIGHSETLTITKRGSGQTQQIPVVVPEVDGVKYLVSTRGESQWVKNVRANPEVALGTTKYVATEIPVEQRAPIIAVYKPLAGRVVDGYWRELPNDTDHPIFALTPAM
jgi:F420H(2)-dependent quinone reductase